MPSESDKVSGKIDMKLTLSFGAIVMVLMITVTCLASWLFISLNQREENRLATVSAMILSESINKVSFSGKYHTRLLAEEMKIRIPQLAFISVETPEGYVIAHSDPSKNNTMMLDDSDCYLRAKSLQSGQAAIGEHRHGGIIFKEVVLPYKTGINQHPAGVVRTGFNLENVRMDQKSALVLLLTLAGLLTLLSMWGVLKLSKYYGGAVYLLARRLQGIADSVPGLLYQFLYKPSGEVKMLFTSQELKKILDIDPSDSDTIFPEFYSCIDDEEKDRFMHTVKAAAASPGVWNLDCRYMRHDGKKIFIHIIARTEKTDEGAIFSGVILDITSQKETGEELRRSRNMLTYVMNAIPQGILWKDKNSIAMGCNKVFADIARIADPSLVPGKTDTELTRSIQSSADYKSEDLEIMKSNTPKHHILRQIRLTDGTYRWLDITKIPLSETDGVPYGILVVMEDITDRKNAEEELRRSRNMLASIMDSIPQAIAWKNCASIFLGCNKKFADMAGYENPELIAGKSDKDFSWGNKNSASYLKDDREVMESNIPKRHIQEPIETENGKRWLDTSKIPLTDEHGNVYGILAVLEDITDRKNAEEEKIRLLEQLGQSQKMESIGRLAGGVAHDFNNMLHAILGHADIALSELPPDSPVYSDVQEIQHSAKRSAELTRQLLGFARKQTAIPQILNLNDTIPGMLKMLKRLIGENIRLTWTPGSQLHSVKIDPGQVDQILANLVVNARDAIDSEPKGIIAIETSNVTVDSSYPSQNADTAPGEYVMISVSDNGHGIPKSVMAHIFEPFFTTKTIGKGTGLGLATVFGIIRQNNGFINVYSEPEQGTCFKIYLPITDEIPPEKEILPQSKIPQGSETILLVEDEPQVLRLARQVLEKNGYKVIAGAYPIEAFNSVKDPSVKIDLLITDMIMPGMNGKELQLKISELKPDIRTIFMSGYTAEVITNEKTMGKHSAFLQKPFTMVSFLNKVRDVLDAP